LDEIIFSGEEDDALLLPLKNTDGETLLLILGDICCRRRKRLYKRGINALNISTPII